VHIHGFSCWPQRGNAFSALDWRYNDGSCCFDPRNDILQTKKKCQCGISLLLTLRRRPQTPKDSVDSVPLPFGHIRITNIMHRNYPSMPCSPFINIYCIRIVILGIIPWARTLAVTANLQSKLECPWRRGMAFVSSMHESPL
jgi:hypothetical protein